MPPNPAPHLTGWLDELGITEAGAMAAVPISWREIQAWHDSLHLRLEPWELRLLRKLSKAYVTESREAESEHRPPPWRAGVSVEEQAADVVDLRALFS
jgi:hypothetical protein